MTIIFELINQSSLLQKILLDCVFLVTVVLCLVFFAMVHSWSAKLAQKILQMLKKFSKCDAVGKTHIFERFFPFKRDEMLNDYKPRFSRPSTTDENVE